MPKYWVKNYFAYGSFPEVGQKQKTEGKKRKQALARCATPRTFVLETLF